jgi:hypothetical protein
MRPFIVGLVLVGAVVALPASAVGQLGRVEIAGTVTDQSGAVLPGVTITATLPATGASRTVVTDAAGKYRFNQLPVGTYTIQAELPGFVRVVSENVRLRVGESGVLDFRMTLATVEESVTVTGEAPQIDTTKSELSGNVSEIQVQQLPVIGRNWLGFAVLAPGVKSDGSEGTQDAPPTAGVGVGRQDRVLLDGADLNNRSTASNVDLRISKEVIAEFQVKTAQFDAQLGQSGTSVVQAISKSGTDSFRGNTYFYFRDESLNAADFFTGRKPPYRNEQVGGTLGGPVLKGQTHFFFNYERQNEPKTVVSNTGVPSLDVPVDGTDLRTLWFFRGDHAITQNHRVSGRFNRYTRFEPHSGVGGLTPPVGSLDNDWKVNRYNAALNSVFGQNFVNQLTVNYMNTDRFFGKRPGSGALHVFPSVSIGGNVGGGLEDPDYWAFRNDASVFFTKGGDHNLKFGGYFERAYLKGRFLFALNGVFSYTRDPANLANCCGSENQADWDKSQFPIPVQFAQVLGDPSIDAPNKVASAFIQDDWTLTPRLTVNLGLRYDLEFGSLANDLDNTLLQEPYENDLDNFQPRFGFAYDLLGDKRTIVRGGAGRFVTQTFLNVTFFVERTNRVRQLNVTLRNPANDPNFGLDPLDGRTFEDFTNLIGNPNFPLDIAIFDTNTEQPDVWSYTVGGAHQLTDDLSVSMDYVHQRSNSMLRSIDANLFCCRPDGQALPVVSGNFPELGGQVVGVGRPDPRFNTIRQFGNYGRARYHGVQAALDKRFSNDYQFGVTYLLSKNEDDFSDVFEYPSNNFDLEDEFSTSAFDQRHRVTANWVTRLPYEVTFSGLLFMASGRAIPVTVGGLDLFATAPEPRGRNARPTCGSDPRFDPGCRALSIADGQRVPRNAFRGDATYRVDMRVARTFRIGQRVGIEPSFEMFNVFNRENHDPTRFNNNLGSASFGTPGPTANQPYFPRQIQLGIRLDF